MCRLDADFSESPENGQGSDSNTDWTASAVNFPDAQEAITFIARNISEHGVVDHNVDLSDYNLDFLLGRQPVAYDIVKFHFENLTRVCRRIHFDVSYVERLVPVSRFLLDAFVLYSEVHVVSLLRQG